jgi:hypothetical protein
MTMPNDVLECPICFDTINKINVTMTACGHIFHESCIQKLLKVENTYHKCTTCPMCRGNINHK